MYGSYLITDLNQSTVKKGKKNKYETTKEIQILIGYMNILIRNDYFYDDEDVPMLLEIFSF